MADAKISDLPNLTTPDDADVLAIVDTSATTTKKITYANLAAALGMEDPTVPRVLRVEGGGHINHGRFWPEGETFTDDLGAFMWDGWVKHRGGEYVISDGYGGAHALLWGFGGANTPQTGNIYNGTGNTSFGGVYAPEPDEWVHIAVAWDGAHRIGVFVNGLLDGLAAFEGPRRAIGWSTGAGGHLYVCGSDHSNGDYDLAYLRGFDRNKFPIPDMVRPFVPERVPSRWMGPAIPCDFYCDYTAGSGITYPDTSPMGCVTVDADGPVFHHGKPENRQEQGLGESYSPPQDSGTMPVKIADAACPLGRPVGTSPAPTRTAGTPGTPPGGCLVYDSFTRANQTLAFQAAPSLGSTEAGSLGVLAWQAARIGGNVQLGTFGILDNQAVCTSNGVAVAWVAIGTASQDVRASRSLAAKHSGEVGLALRVVDANNYLVVQFSATSFWANHGANRSSGHVYYSKVVAGESTYLGSFNVGTDDWSTLRVTAVGSTITVYYGGGSGWTEAGEFTEATHATGQGAGLAAPSVNSDARWLDFAAFTAS
jgi:hypothetical protein